MTWGYENTQIQCSGSRIIQRIVMTILSGISFKSRPLGQSIEKQQQQWSCNLRDHVRAAFVPVCIYLWVRCRLWCTGCCHIVVWDRRSIIIIMIIIIISKALNPSVSNLHEARGAVYVQLEISKLHIQLKPSKQRNQRRQKTKNKQTNKARNWLVKGQGPNIK